MPVDIYSCREGTRQGARKIGFRASSEEDKLLKHLESGGGEHLGMFDLKDLL